MTVRAATPGDVEAIAEFARALSDHDLCTAGRVPTIAEVKALVERIAFVAVENGQVVGALLGRRDHVSWLLCPIANISDIGAELLDAAAAAGAKWGKVKNAALREAILAERPNYIVDGDTVRSD